MKKENRKYEDFNNEGFGKFNGCLWRIYEGSTSKFEAENQMRKGVVVQGETEKEIVKKIFKI